MSTTTPLTKILSLTLATVALGGAMAASADARSPFVGAAGDFNGDGSADVASFTRGPAADVFVALSTGSGFGVRAKWHDLFASGNSIPLVGDFNGDGKADVASFSRGIYGQVHVAASNGVRFVNTGGPWISSFALGQSIPQVGDFNGDGRSDVASFTSNNGAWVALSTGSSFSAPAKWHDIGGDESAVPVIGDYDGDGRDDVVWVDYDSGYALIARSDGARFEYQVGISFSSVGSGGRAAAGDIDRDGDDDFVAFRGAVDGDVVVKSWNGDNLGQPELWHDDFGGAGEVPGLGDFNGDGCSDLAAFTRGTLGRRHGLEVLPRPAGALLQVLGGGEVARQLRAGQRGDRAGPRLVGRHPTTTPHAEAGPDGLASAVVARPSARARSAVAAPRTAEHRSVQLVAQRSSEPAPAPSLSHATTARTHRHRDGHGGRQRPT